MNSIFIIRTCRQTNNIMIKHLLHFTETMSTWSPPPVRNSIVVWDNRGSDYSIETICSDGIDISITIERFCKSSMSTGWPCVETFLSWPTHSIFLNKCLPLLLQVLRINIMDLFYKKRGNGMVINCSEDASWMSTACHGDFVYMILISSRPFNHPQRT